MHVERREAFALRRAPVAQTFELVLVEAGPIRDVNRTPLRHAHVGNEFQTAIAGCRVVALRCHAQRSVQVRRADATSILGYDHGGRLRPELHYRFNGGEETGRRCKSGTQEIDHTEIQPALLSALSDKWPERRLVEAE